MLYTAGHYVPPTLVCSSDQPPFKNSFKMKSGFYKCFASLFYYKFKSALPWYQYMKWKTASLFLIKYWNMKLQKLWYFDIWKSIPEYLFVSFYQFVIGKPVYILLTLSQSSFWSGWAENPSHLCCRITQYIEVTSEPLKII